MLFVACADHWEQVEAPLKTTDFQFYQQDGARFSKCFLENVAKYTSLVDLKFASLCTNEVEYDRINVTVSVVTQLGSLGVYYPFGVILIYHDSPQLSVFGHEYVRVLCQVGQCCDWDHDSTDWSGLIGDMWSFAETEAVRICHAN